MRWLSFPCITGGSAVAAKPAATAPAQAHLSSAGLCCVQPSSCHMASLSQSVRDRRESEVPHGKQYGVVSVSQSSTQAISPNPLYFPGHSTNWVAARPINCRSAALRPPTFVELADLAVRGQLENGGGGPVGALVRGGDALQRSQCGKVLRLYRLQAHMASSSCNYTPAYPA